MDVTRDEELAHRVESAIQIVTGFPCANIRFRDISPIVENDPGLFRAVIDAMAGLYKARPPDCIVCIESWGFVFGAPVAYVLGTRLCLARHPGKLPRESITESYDMCYAQGRVLAIQGQAIGNSDRVLVIDDIIASGGSALAAVSLVEKAGGRCIGVVCLAAFADWGMKRIVDKGIPVHAIARL
jgi:adenine phosphoribosyltransferase